MRSKMVLNRVKHRRTAASLVEPRSEFFPVTWKGAKIAEENDKKKRKIDIGTYDVRRPLVSFVR